RLLEGLQTRLPENEGSSSELPVLLQVVISDNGWYLPSHSLPEELEGLELPAEISALALVDSLLDQSGGRLKRRSRQVLLNDKASRALSSTELDGLFGADDEEVSERALYTGTCF